MAELCAICGERPRYPRRGVCLPCHYKRRKAKNRNPRTVDEENVPRVPCAPIKGWLLANKSKMLVKDIALLCGLDESGVGKILNGTYATASLDTVDKILVAFDAPMMLGRLYPELYEDPSVFTR